MRILAAVENDFVEKSKSYTVKNRQISKDTKVTL